jgi:hypothetical protein
MLQGCKVLGSDLGQGKDYVLKLDSLWSVDRWPKLWGILFEVPKEESSLGRPKSRCDIIKADHNKKNVKMLSGSM